MKRWMLGSLALALVATALVALQSARASGAQASLAPVLSASDWIGARPTASSLAGKVVVIDVFTVDCYNCQNVVPTLRALYAQDRDRGLAVVGIHAPETPPERGRAYVEQSLARQGITWPIALDNGFELWHDYGVNAWPTQFFVDRHGTLRTTIVGDSQDAAVKSTVEALLAEK